MPSYAPYTLSSGPLGSYIAKKATIYSLLIKKHVGIFLSPDILVYDVHFKGQNFWNFQETFIIV
jgi:hypothetical protein